MLTPVTLSHTRPLFWRAVTPPHPHTLLAPPFVGSLPSPPCSADCKLAPVRTPAAPRTAQAHSNGWRPAFGISGELNLAGLSLFVCAPRRVYKCLTARTRV